MLKSQIEIRQICQNRANKEKRDESAQTQPIFFVRSPFKAQTAKPLIIQGHIKKTKVNVRRTSVKGAKQI